MTTGALKTFVFHGPNRPFDSELLATSDVVLRTYATLVADEKNLGVLHQIEWYRVVLDEGKVGRDIFWVWSVPWSDKFHIAHWIRNAASKQFRAASSLQTSRRWCLTGTPVQNRLGDLSSLAAFLRLPPVATKVAFERQILDPLSQSGLGFATPLREYLRAFCLRRMETILNLPPSDSRIITLRLSKEERDRYARVLEDARRKIDASVSRGTTLRCSLLFIAILRLRMLCNLGRSPNSELPEPTVGCGSCSTEEDGAAPIVQPLPYCPECGRPLIPLISGSELSNVRERQYSAEASAALKIMDQPSPNTLETSGVVAPQAYNSTKLTAILDTIIGAGPEGKQ